MLGSPQLSQTHDHHCKPSIPYSIHSCESRIAASLSLYSALSSDDIFNCDDFLGDNHITSQITSVERG